MPKSKDDCNQLEPLHISRKVRAASVIRSEIMELLRGNFHFDTSFRATEVVTDTLNSMSVFTKHAATRIALCDSSLISCGKTLRARWC